MLRLILLINLIFLLHGCASNDSIFELSPQQSMLITGKGPGQDAAINPYKNTQSIAIVKSLRSSPVDVRVQYKGNIIEIVAIPANEKKEIFLEKGYELYLDSERKAKVKVTFKATSKN